MGGWRLSRFGPSTRLIASSSVVFPMLLSPIRTACVGSKISACSILRKFLGSSGFSVSGQFDSAVRSFAPRGYVYQPRVAAKLPWVGKGYATNPERVASLFSQAPFTQPRWGWIFVRSLPRVASPQPWADIRSPFRAKKSALPNPPGTLKPEKPVFDYET
uniref:Uncharacterized protein n=2 Tax=Candidatus Kentrum sp. TUN TaxID=2126343 RepID=A0A450ZIA2_9GAMM|nr:MAG: hypothetical protein BECKTUN1418F_GA0071002_102321 [Candidatus Kentron sp. TUN]